MIFSADTHIYMVSLVINLAYHVQWGQKLFSQPLIFANSPT